MEINNLLGGLSTYLTPEFIADILELYESRETKIAVENLCVQLIELDVPLDERRIDVLIELIREHDVNRKYIPMLRSLIMNK